MSAKKNVVGMLAGVAIGAVLGILLAPDKGSETRKKLSKKGSNMVNDLKDKYENTMDKAETVVNDVKGKAEEMKNVHTRS